jgi:hypothetical protein
MRTYVTVYDSQSKTTRIAYRDSEMNLNEFYVDSSIPPFEDDERARVIAAALNAAQKH